MWGWCGEAAGVHWYDFNKGLLRVLADYQVGEPGLQPIQSRYMYDSKPNL